MSVVTGFHRSSKGFGLGLGWRSVTAAQWISAISGWVVLLAVDNPPSSPFLSALRAVMVFAFVLLGPGFAVSGLLSTRDAAERWVLTTALSLAFGLLVSVAFTVARNDSTILRLLSLTVLTSAAALAGIFETASRAGAGIREREPR